VRFNFYGSCMTTSSPLGARWDAHTWGLLLVLCGAFFLDNLDVSMVGVALPSIGSDLHLSTSDLQWVVSGYVLGYGGLLLLGGRTTDIVGRRKVFLVATAVFAVASILGGVANDGTFLIVTRFIKGVGAAFTVPAGLSLLTTTFPQGPARNKALSMYASFAAVGFAGGLVFGGLLTEIGWRWTFLVPGPLAALLVVAGLRLIPRDEPVAAGQRQGFDIGGAVSVSAAMLVLVRTVVTAPEHGWGDSQTLVGFAITALLLIAFFVLERRVRSPLVRLGILRSGPLVRANIGAVLLFGCYIAFQFIATLYLQSLLGWGALETGLAFLPAGVITVFLAPRVGGVVNRFGTAPVIAAGFVSFTAAFVLFLRINESPTYIGTILPTMVLCGLGYAMCLPALNMQATDGIADHEQGLASGLLNTSFQVGGAIILAVITAIVSSKEGTSSDPAVVLGAYKPAIAVIAALAAVAFLVSLSGVIARRRGTAAARSAESRA
jgi:EmrB/QacA subfamily drug resistance transporter